MKTIYVVEDWSRRRTLFRLFGIEWLGTYLWWVSPLWMIWAGIGLAFLLGIGQG